mmetsp:Transcript_1176/g.3296  ORF Transcript_1176/g.3296 Transcript_1176/m.3296 type:complete len:202 (-) Transcript_1176:263-868(-)
MARELSQIRDLQRLPNGHGRNLTQPRELLLRGRRHWPLAPADEEVRRKASAAQSPDAVLGQLRLLLGRPHDQRDHQAHGHLHLNVATQLPQRFQEDLCIPVANRPSHFHEAHVRLLPSHRELRGCLQPLEDGVHDVDREAHRLPKVRALPLLPQHPAQDAAGGDAVRRAQAQAELPLVAPEVEVDFGTVLQHEDLAVLLRR